MARFVCRGSKDMATAYRGSGRAYSAFWKAGGCLGLSEAARDAGR